MFRGKSFACAKAVENSKPSRRKRKNEAQLLDAINEKDPLEVIPRKSRRDENVSEGTQKRGKRRRNQDENTTDNVNRTAKKNYMKVPEEINGIVTLGGEDCVIVKWKRRKEMEHISFKDLTDDLKKLTMSYLHTRIHMLSANENSSEEEEEDEPVVVGIKGPSLNLQKINTLSGIEEPSVDLKRLYHLNTLSFKKKQKEFIEKNGIPDEYGDITIWI